MSNTPHCNWRSMMEDLQNCRDELARVSWRSLSFKQYLDTLEREERWACERVMELSAEMREYVDADKE